MCQAKCEVLYAGIIMRGEIGARATLPPAQAAVRAY